MVIHIHPGRFNIHFLGVLIRTDGKAELESFRHTDRGASLPEHLLLDLPIDPFISDISRLTVLDHELRHFHDALLYPFGAALLRYHMWAATNGFGVGVALGRFANANVLPVPLLQWLYLPERGRAEYLEQQSAYVGRRLVPPDLPVLDPGDDLGDLSAGITLLEDAEIVVTKSRLAGHFYSLVETLWRAPHSHEEPAVGPAVVLWEVPGIICQLAAVRRVAGDTCTERFQDWIFQHGPRAYRRGFEILDLCRQDRSRQATARDYLALTAWSQMGRFKTEAAESSPLARLGRLRDAAHRGLRWSDGDAFIDLVRVWDEALQTDSLAGLDDSTAELASLVERSSTRAEVEGVDDGPLSIEAAALRAYHQAHVIMKEAFFLDPDAFIDPVDYDARRSSYPEPALAASYAESDAQGMKYDWLDITPADSRPAIDSSIAFDLATIVEASDHLFLASRQTLHAGGQYWIRRLFGLETLLLIS